MVLFGLSLQELLYSLFLPFLLFYALVFALLKKTKILSESNSINSLTALTLAAIGTISVYQIGLMPYLTWIALATMLATFFGLFVLGTLLRGTKKMRELYYGKELEDFERIKKASDELWESFKKEKDVAKKKEILANLSGKVKALEELTEKLRKDLKIELPWYTEYKALEEKLRQAGG